MTQEPVRDSRARVVGRRVVVLAVVALQLGFVVRGYWAPHKEFAFQMFSESSQWRADIVRVTRDGREIPIDEQWSGYEWSDLVRDRGLRYPGVTHHADSGVDNQLAFLEAALNWVASNTPRDRETEYLEATVTYRRNTHAPVTVVLRSDER